MFQLPQQNTGKQFTIRFDADLYELFDEIHNQTRIPKSTLIREFTLKGIQQIRQSGIQHYFSAN